jgi:amino acid adenylation domain-containing protein
MSANLVDALRRHAQRQPRRDAYVFLDDEGREEGRLTYEELDRRARATAVRLQEMGSEGQRALLLYPPNGEYLAAFMGCLYAKVLPVPAHPPKGRRRAVRLASMMTDAGLELVLQPSAGGLSRDVVFPPGTRTMDTADIDPRVADRWRAPRLEADDIAFLQYTSGSTSTPRGVMVSHGNLVHNQRLLQASLQNTAESVIVTWLPLYHDMGLIGNVLQSLFLGATCVLMSPMSFLQRPALWLQAITRYRGTTSGGPNFAYDLCTRRITTAEKEALDLSSWNAAFNGAEPVRSDTLVRFSEAFAGAGFRPGAFFPCYGLAEATLFVSGGPLAGASGPRDLRLRVEQGRVGCGVAGDQKVLVVDAETARPCPDGRIGELWIQGPSVAKGYWRNPELTREVFGARTADGDGPYLRTGDLGFRHDGELFIAGRLKDLIIIRGVNHYPQDIEATVQDAHPALRAGCGAVFAVDAAGEERVVVVQEVERAYRDALEPLIETIRAAVAETHQVELHAVCLVGPGAVPKTSSGKVQRRACRASFLGGEVAALSEWRRDESEPVMPDVARVVGGPADTERWITARVAARLGLDLSLVDPTAPLVRCGLDSLGALELGHAVEQRFGVRLALASLIGDASLRDLAREVTERTVARDGARVDATIASGAVIEAVPRLSEGQRALWFLQEAAPESAAYNLSGAVHLEAGLDVDALERAFQVVLSRHSQLDARFERSAGEPTRVRAGGAFTLVKDDLTGVAEAAWRRRLAMEANRPFDLTATRPVRAFLFRIDGGHVLQIVAHHIVADLRSMEILLRDLGEAYGRKGSAADRGADASPMPYEGFVSWQHDMLASGDAAQGAEFWSRRLEGAPAALELPTDRPRPKMQSFRGGVYRFEVGSRAFAALKTIARDHGVTPFVALLAAYKAWLHRYTGATDLVVGTPASGRTQARFADTVGYFVNPLPLRTEVRDRDRFVDLVARCGDTVRQAFAHQDYPFPRIVKDVGTRDAARSPLFQTLFVFDGDGRTERAASALSLNLDGRPVDLGGLRGRSVAIDLEGAQFDLSLALGDLGDGLAATFTYNADLFEPETVRRMAAHFQALVEGIAARPHGSLAALPLLSADERHRAVVTWNDTAADYPADECLHELIEAQVRRTPQAVAVTDERETLTYATLNARANRIARRLAAAGVGPDDVVAVWHERSTALVTSLLAILKAGGAYLPLDTELPLARLRVILDDARPAALIAPESRRAELAALAGPGAPIVSGEEDAVVPGDECDLGTPVSPANLAYLIYTSGSTGKPKGVMVPHRGICNRLRWMQAAYGLRSDDVVLQKTPYGFDVSVWEFFWPLFTGARLVMARPGGHRDPDYLLDTIVAEGVTTLHFVPSMLRAFLDHSGVETARSLRRVFASGEALTPDLVKRFHARCAAPLHNLYGPTEASVDVSYHECGRTAEAATATVPIGRPIANTRLYVLDAALEPVPIGVAGEIHIGGVGLARGYSGRPDLTAERFRPDPLSGQPGARLYATGDVGRYLPSGEIEFLERRDQQVKLRGFRIELGEIESVLREQDAVREAVVLLRRDGSEDPRLVAYVVAPGADVSALRAFLRLRLPDYMVPSSFVTLDALPLTASGKLNRAALPAPDRKAEASADFAAPRSALETALAVMWAEMLGVEEVGVHDNFFALGGHSLLITRVLARVREEFAVHLPVQSFLAAPTVAALAALVQAGASVGPDDADLRALLKDLETMSADELATTLGREGIGG